MKEVFLKGNGIRYDATLFGAPYGVRIFVNGRKSLDLVTAIAVNTEKDVFMNMVFEVDEVL